MKISQISVIWFEVTKFHEPVERISVFDHHGWIRIKISPALLQYSKTSYMWTELFWFKPEYLSHLF